MADRKVLGLLSVFLVLLLTVPEDKEFALAKKRYHKFLDSIASHEKYGRFSRPVVLTGYRSLGKGLLGWNSGKGSEVSVCTNGSANSIMHIILHEFAHQTVKEYSHSERFWANLDEIRTLAEQSNLYDRINSKTEICGSYVDDNGR